MHARMFTLVALSLLSFPVFAGCKNPMTQAEMNRCAALDLSTADGALNAAYKSLMRQLDKNQQAEVKAIQLSWIKFKDQNCRFEASSAEGGSMQPMLRDACLTQLTEERTNVLKNWIQTFGQ